MQFGKRSERLPEDQLHFAFEELEASIAEVAKTSPEQREGIVRRRRAGRGRLPAHLPRVEVVLVSMLLVSSPKRLDEKSPVRLLWGGGQLGGVCLAWSAAATR